MTGRRPAERGSTLLLFPAAVLVLMILSAIAIDLSTVHLARRELLRTASQAADDAAAMLDQQAARAGDFTVIDAAAAQRVVLFEMEVADLPGKLVGSPDVTVDDTSGTVTVLVSMEVDRLFGKIAPGTSTTDRITVQVSGRLIDQG